LHAGWSRRRRPACLIALTSIHWREAWKYGERAFRYCQHDLGHAIAAIRIAAALAGLGAESCLTGPTRHRFVTGIDRDDDFVDAEREDPGCLLEIRPDGQSLVVSVSRAAFSTPSAPVSGPDTPTS
jgi:nitroreductase